MVGGKLGTVWCLVFCCPDAINYSKGTWSVVNCFTPPPPHQMYCIRTRRHRLGWRGAEAGPLLGAYGRWAYGFFLAAPAATLGFCGVFFYVIRGSAQFVFSYDKHAGGPVDLSIPSPLQDVSRRPLSTGMYWQWDFIRRVSVTTSFWVVD